MTTNGVQIRVTHAGSITSSILLSDVDSNTHDPGKSPGRGAYVPSGGYLDLAFTGDVLRSFESGGIRSLITNGYVTAAIMYGGLVQGAAEGAVTITSVAGGASPDTYTATVDDSLFLVDTTNDAVTITLPTGALHNKKRFRVIDTANNAATNNIIIAAAAGGNTINGGASYTLNADNGLIEFVWNSVAGDWFYPVETIGGSPSGTATGELAGTYPAPTIADNVIDAANAKTGVASLVVDKGTPGSCYVAMDDGAGNTQTPLADSTYTFSIGGVPLTVLTAKALAASEDEFTIGASGTTAAEALRDAINAHSTISLRLVASLGGVDAVGLRYVHVYTKLAADLLAGSQVTVAVNAGTAGAVVNRGTAIAAGKYALRHVSYVVVAQDMYLAGGQGEVRLALGFTAVKWASVLIRTSATDSSLVTWTGVAVIAGGIVTVDNSGATDFAAGNVIEAIIYGTVA